MLTQRGYRYKILRQISDGALTSTQSSPVWDLQELSENVPKDHIGFERFGIYIRISAVSGTNQTMAVALEVSEDGTNFETLTDSLTGLNAVGVRTALVTNMYPARFVRLKFTLGGSNPSFTFEAITKVIL